jgi:hypothetical protein
MGSASASSSSRQQDYLPGLLLNALGDAFSYNAHVTIAAAISNAVFVFLALFALEN